MLGRRVPDSQTLSVSSKPETSCKDRLNLRNSVSEPVYSQKTFLIWWHLPTQHVFCAQQHAATALLSSMLYFLTMSLRIFAECHANQQQPPNAVKILIGVDIRQRQQPSGPISQQYIFSPTYRVLILPSRQQVPHSPIGIK